VTQDEGAAAFRAAAQALREAGDKDLRREVSASLREVTKPFGARIIRHGAVEMPHRGGLSARLAKARMTQTNAMNGRSPGIGMRFKVREGYDLAALDKGNLKHPVFARPGRPRVWATQRVPRDAYTREFLAGRDQVAGELVHTLESVTERIAQRSKR